VSGLGWSVAPIEMKLQEFRLIIHGRNDPLYVDVNQRMWKCMSIAEIVSRNSLLSKLLGETRWSVHELVSETPYAPLRYLAG
jgi:hypothetical protein